MALRISVTARVTISQDNAVNPQELTFDSGSKTLVDSSTYNESVGHTFNVAAGAVDQQVDLGSLAEVDVLYLMSKSSGLTLKLVPVGGSVGATPATEIVINAPAVIPFKLSAIYVSNPGASAATLVIGAAGN